MKAALYFRVMITIRRDVAGFLSALYGVFWGRAAAGQIELKPYRPRRSGLHVLQSMAGYGREDVRRSRLSSSPGGDYLIAGMHDAAVADGSKQHGHRRVNAENARTQIGIPNRPPPGEAEM